MRHVIVTGGSRGLGLALVEGLLKIGYRVSTCSRQQTAAMERITADPTYSSRFLWHPCAIGDPIQVDGFVRQAVEWAGHDGLWGLVNNAGIALEGVLASFPNVESERILRVNLLGALQMARAAIRAMLRSNGGGRIVNISSIIGTRGYTGLAAYSASKAGLDGLTRALAREVGRRGITVNSVAPGYLRTEMVEGLSPSQRQQIVNRTPLGRLGEPADVTPVVTFLLSDEAAFITGQTIVIDGGIGC